MTTSNNNERRHPSGLRIATAVPAVAVILFASTSAHALVAPPSASPHQRPLRRSTPAPRADRTVLRYIDERADAEPVFRDLWTLREQANTIKQHDRQQYFDFVHNVEPTAPSAMPSKVPSAAPTASAAPSVAPSAGFSLSSLLSSVASLREQAKTIKQHDRQQYFNFVNNVDSTAPSARPSDVPGAAPSASAAPSVAPSASFSPSSMLSSMASLREQAKTIKKHDRQQYFDFVAHSFESTAPPLYHLALEPGPVCTSMPSAMPGDTPREVPSAAESAAGIGLSPSSLLSSLPSSVASLWVQARTVAEDDRRLYFDFVKSQSLDADLAMESRLSTGNDNPGQLPRVDTGDSVVVNQESVFG